MQPRKGSPFVPEAQSSLFFETPEELYRRVFRELKQIGRAHV